MPFFRNAAFLSFAAISVFMVIPAHAITMKECSAKYQSAKESNSLNGMKWTEFRKTQCSTSVAKEEGSASLDEATAEAEPVAATSEAPKGVTFPSKVDNKFSAETPSKQRMKTCLEAYHGNKSANTLSGMRWVQKGGGYYSICNARLKRAS